MELADTPNTLNAPVAPGVPGDPTADPVFVEEQDHLSATYAKLQELERACAGRLAANREEMQQFKSTMDDELGADFDGDDIAMETYAEYAVMNNVVDSFNIAIDLDSETLKRLRILLAKPYFAKVRLQFPGKPEPRDVYLGSVGASDERRRQLVVDWRSPVAETYYSQQSGPMTYEANGRQISVDLLLRRQFDIERDELRSYFDTSVAIEDPMLLASLAHQRTSQLQAITATIQREQNQVIRHEDVPVLLVQGVAGSGKTSVMLQRIAYLLFKDRANLTADQVYLLSPNPVFERYIQNVLPELGEKNPHTMLWSELMERLGAGNRNLGAAVDPQTLAAIDERAADFELRPTDMREVRVGDRVLLTVEQVWKAVEKYSKSARGPRLMTLVEETLLEKLERKLDSLAGTEAVQDEMFDLDEEEQERVFGSAIDPVTDEELRECAARYLEVLCAPAFAAVENAEWLRLDRIAMRMLGENAVSGAEWLYLKMALTGKVNATARFVMVDEVQDYTAAQLMVLARYFSKAHFLLLGDENQAIRPGTASFAEMRSVFERARGEVGECRLMTSYRSSPEITALFASLADDGSRLEIASVQPSGDKPRIEAFATLDEYRDALVAAIRSWEGKPGLGAVVVGNRKRLHWMGRLLQEALGDRAPLVMGDGGRLPAEGTVLIDLGLAKGLEFDRVIVADAQAQEYPDDDLARRRLYTAVSRATKEVTVLAQGELTPLLAGGR